MAESETHLYLVKKIDQYVECVLKIDRGYIMLDAPNYSSFNKPPLIRDFRPDVYAKTKNLLIIGEAKTEEDWDKRHSHEQYRAYVNECLNFCGAAILIIAVPWRVERSIRSRIKNMFKIDDLPNKSVLIISDMWGI